MTPRRPRRSDSDTIRQELVELFSNFENQLGTRDIRTKVKSLIPAFRRLRDLGSSLIPEEHCGAARDRILYYFRSYPLNVISGEELMVVSGIQDWPRRVRELRVQFGWPIVTGTTARQMLEENEFPEGNVDLQGVGPDDYLLLETRADREAAYRWNLANEIRRERLSVKARILKFLRSNVGKPVTGEELRYVAKNRTEWARRARELRTEEGWPVVTKNTGRPDLPIGTYVLEADRQGPVHDRIIPDATRRQVLRRDGYACRECGWSHDEWNPSDPRHLELHHDLPHVEGGLNTGENLITLCTVCHDRRHG